jgi:twitching motility protein PilT
MELDSLIESAAGSGASDLHLEAGMPAAMRIRGALRVAGEPVAPRALADFARGLLGEEQWPVFVERRSFDMSRTIRGVRCRINIFQTARGVGLAIRLLSAFQATVEKLNLHPDLKKLVKNTHGLILISGPTGCGKSSTMAALIQEINLTDTRHIITVESPIEYTFRSRRAFIRQREVGRDTPSFEQALHDALREDPDVLMVGEMREPETMRLTLSASETGHLVLATVHSSTCAEALQRVASAFPAEIQSAVCAQLADCLVAVVSQRLRFREDLNIRVPECEILMATHAVKNFIRTREFFKIVSSLETGADHGMWSFQRYGKWLDSRTNFFVPGKTAETPDSEPSDDSPATTALPPLAASPKAEKRAVPSNPSRSSDAKDVHRIEIEPDETGFGKILKTPQ